jgi:hypothetical protein
MRVTAEYPYIFPPLWFFLKASCADLCLLADTFKIPKRPRINRYGIAGKDGEHWLIVPLHRPTGWASSVREVAVVPDASWRRSHLRSLATCYAMAPYREYYWDSLEALLIDPESSYFSLARRSILWLASKLGLGDRGWIPLSEVSGEAGGEGGLLRACQKLRAKEYVQLAGDRDVRDERGFLQAGISVVRVSIPQFRYRNLAGWGGEELSALDLLFNLGPEAAIRLRELVSGSIRAPEESGTDDRDSGITVE